MSYPKKAKTVIKIIYSLSTEEQDKLWSEFGFFEEEENNKE